MNWTAHTRLLPHTSRPPIGAKMMPMMKRVGSTVFGVSMGCHALRRCCLKAVSGRKGLLRSVKGESAAGRTRGTSPAALFLLAFAVAVVGVVFALFLAIENGHGCRCRRRRDGMRLCGSTLFRAMTLITKHRHSQWLPSEPSTK